MRGVQKTEALRYALPQVFAVDLERHIAPHVDFPQIERRVPVADPFGDDLADAAGGLQTDGVESGGDKAILQFGRLAQVVAHIRCKALRAAKEFLNAGLLERGYPAHRVHQHRFEVAEVTGNLAEGEILGNPFRAPRPRIRLEGADQEFPGVVFEVAAVIVIAQHRHIRMQSGHVLEQHIVVFAGMQRHGDADARGEIPGPHAAAQHHIVRIDAAVLGVHTLHPLAVMADGRDLELLENSHAPGARALGERLGDVDGIRVAVARNVNAADHILEIGERIEGANFARGIRH